MADYSAAFFPNTTTQQRQIPPRKLSASTKSTYSPANSPTTKSPTRKGSSKSASSKPESSGSNSRATPSSHAGTRIAFAALATDPNAIYTDQLTQARTNASQNSDGKSSTHTTSQYPSSSTWTGTNVAVVDRRHAPLTADPKAEQRFNKELMARERAPKKGVGQGWSEKDYPNNDRRSESLSSSSLAGSNSSVVRISSDPSSTDAFFTNPFTRRHGRRYLRDLTLAYPLPCDLVELHRQIMRTMLLVQVFGGPVCTPNFQNKYPKKVLEVACGTGFWSSLCHQYFSQQGHSVSFTGIDIAPLCPDMGKDNGMKWQFVQHDLRRTPLPFSGEEFDLIMVKDLSLGITPTTSQQQLLMDEYMRILRPGGSLEIWDGDHNIRMLVPHVPPSAAADDSDSDDEEQDRANTIGIYILTAQTPLTSPQNQYLIDYNTWVSKSLQSRNLTAIPCTHIRPLLLQEADLAEIESRRLAIPLSEVRWEREGVGGATTKDGTSARGTGTSPTTSKAAESDRKILSSGQAALRRTALVTVVQMIEALEPLLRAASGKGQDEWDRWQNNMMNDLMKQNGTSCGECLEVGAWWATKK